MLTYLIASVQCSSSLYSIEEILKPHVEVVEPRMEVVWISEFSYPVEWRSGTLGSALTHSIFCMSRENIPLLC